MQKLLVRFLFVAVALIAVFFFRPAVSPVFAACSVACSEGCAAGKCDVGGCTQYGYSCCKTCPTKAPTKAPTTRPTNTPLPTATPAQGTSCSPFGATACRGDNVYKCLTSGWNFYQSCVWNCAGSTVNCQGGVCCPNQTVQYCEYQCNNQCTSPKQAKLCWSSITAKNNQIPGTFIGCFTTTTPCDTCSPTSDTCANMASDCIPPKVLHKDNCSNLFCGAPCSGPGCTGNCSCAASICLGSSLTCDDGCGGGCYGTKVCTGTIRAKVVLLPTTDTSPTAVNSSTDYLTGTMLTVVGLTPIAQGPSGPVSWTGVTTTGTTSFQILPPSSPPYICNHIYVSTDNGANWLTETLGQLADGGTLDFIIGCLPQNGWMQTTTGNVYAATSLRSSIPAIATYFSLANGTHSPGIVTYGTTDAYDFSLDPGPKGEDQVSVPGWLTNQPYTPVNWYERYAHQLDAANKTTIAEPRTEVAQPACTEDPCIFYADGNMTTGTTQWSVGAVGSPKNMILVVKGNLTINAPIRIAAGSFFAAIVRGDITVNSTVNALDGIYMASNENHNAAFSSGASASQLVVNGSVLADTFTMERDLGAANSTTPGESVVFNPQLLFTMPDVMKETPYIWQEVAP